MASAYIAGLKSKRVISYGPYSIMRNPLYFFSSLGFIGAGLTFGSTLIHYFQDSPLPNSHTDNHMRGGRPPPIGEEFGAYGEGVPRKPFPKN